MRAAILSIGDELTLGQNLDTNSQWLSARLAEQGILADEHRTLADDQSQIAAAIIELAAGRQVLLISGGLGPTADDLTREALCDALTPGEDLWMDEAALEQLRTLFTKRGHTMPAMNNKQAMRPRTMRLMPNPNGTAPGLAGELGGCLVFSMPGPPREMVPMFSDHVVPALPRSEGDVILTAMVQEYGMGESVAAEKLGSLMERTRNPMVGTTASDSIVAARIRAQGPKAEMEKAVAATLEQVERAWVPYAFGREGITLADAVAALMGADGGKLVTAESCTGGWLGKMLVDRAGASAFYLGGFVTYSNELKMSLLGVPEQLLAAHGAVSREVACAMAEGAIQRTGTAWSLAITGIAGPDGGTPGKPVGTVHIALGRLAGNSIIVKARHFEFAADRMAIRDRSAKAALQMLRFELLGVPERLPLLWEVGKDVQRIADPVKAAGAAR